MIDTVVLTTRQFEVFCAIKDYITEHDYSPTFTEIAVQCSISRQAIPRYIDLFVRKGILSYVPCETRTIKLKPVLVVEK